MFIESLSMAAVCARTPIKSAQHARRTGKWIASSASFSLGLLLFASATTGCTSGAPPVSKTPPANDPGAGSPGPAASPGDRTPASQASPIEFEAEAAQVIAPMARHSDRGATGQAYVASRDSNAGEVRFSTAIAEAGAYLIWARVRAASPEEDSFFVQVDDSAPHVFFVQEGWGRGWQWARLNDGAGLPLTFALSAGTHRITFATREANAALDRILVTNDLAFSPIQPVTPPPALECNLFVAVSGRDDNPGTREKPFASVPAAAGVALPGETICIRGGRYPGFALSNVRGQSGAFITIKAFPGEKVTFDAQLGKGTASAVIMIRSEPAQNSGYLIFQGFEVTDTNPTIDQLKALDLKNRADLARFEQLHKGYRVSGIQTSGEPHHVIFKNLEVHHLSYHGFGYGFMDTQFIENHVYDLFGYGWYAVGDRHVYRGNTVHDALIGMHLYPHLNDSVIEGNIVYRIDRPAYDWGNDRVLTRGQGILQWGGGNNIVRNNVCFGNLSSGVNINNSRNTLVAHNTTYGNGGYGLYLYANNANVRVVNNVAFDNGRDLRGENAFIPDGIIAENNLFGIDPLFVGAVTHDFRLQEESPAIDRGVAVVQVPTDIDGASRPNGAAVDIGAYEFGGR